MFDATVLWDRAHLAAWREEVRRKGKVLVFTNGCFDLVHVGHVRLLEAAAREGDVLLVALNSDASVRRLKGPSRPIVPLEERAEVIGAIRWVDRVAAFEEDTPYELIRLVQPDILVKGGDWAPEHVVGKDVVDARGGRVVIVPLVEGRSTTSLLRRFGFRG